MSSTRAGRYLVAARWHEFRPHQRLQASRPGRHEALRALFCPAEARPHLVEAKLVVVPLVLDPVEARRRSGPPREAVHAVDVLVGLSEDGKQLACAMRCRYGGASHARKPPCQHVRHHGGRHTARQAGERAGGAGAASATRAACPRRASAPRSACLACTSPRPSRLLALRAGTGETRACPTATR